MSLENLRKICLNLSLLIVSFILINLLRNVQIVGPLYQGRNQVYFFIADPNF